MYKSKEYNGMDILDSIFSDPYHVIKQCTEKETTSLSNFLLTIKLSP
jgi:hypothetical protein